MISEQLSILVNAFKHQRGLVPTDKPTLEGLVNNF